MKRLMPQQYYDRCGINDICFVLSSATLPVMIPLGYIAESHRSGVLHLLYDGLESGGIVEGEVGEDLAVDLDAGLVDETHELGVAEVFEASGSVDTLNPESAEVALLILAVAIGVGQTLFPGVLGNGPYVAAAAEVAAGEFEDFFTTCTRSDVVD